VAFWFLSAGCALLLAALGVVLWVRRPPPVLWPILLIGQLCALVWVLADLWASHATTLLEKEIALTLLFTSSIAIPPLWWESTRRYVLWQGLERPWMHSRWARLPFWVAAAGWLLAVTNPWHGQFMEPVVGGRNQYRWGLKVVGNAHYGIVLATFALCVWAALQHGTREVRRKMAILAGATLAPLVTSLLHVYARVGPREDTVAIGLGLGSLTIIYGVTRKGLFNLLPVGLHEILRRDPSGVLLLDRGGRLLLWNPAAEKMLESILFEPDMPLLRVLAQGLEDGRSGERLGSSEDLTEILTEEDVGTGEPLFRYVGGGGDRWLRLSLTPIPSRRGRIAAVCLRVEDATRDERAARSRHRQADRLHRAEKVESLALMAGGMARDFAGVLATIQGRARMALEDAGRGLPVRRHLCAIGKAAEVAEDLTQQLLDYAGTPVEHRELVDLSALASTMLEALRDAVPREVEMAVDLARSLPPVEGDPNQLRQVLLNLAKSAGEASEGRGGITLRTTSVSIGVERLRREGLTGRLEEGSYVLLEVVDSGPDMAEEEAGRVFDAFFDTRSVGRGLGLALVHRLVESHEGAVTVQTRPGVGTAFLVWLPAAREGGPAHGGARSASRSTARGDLDDFST
jgi:signal transduction histidine kinase